jgi:hypothetical protein
MGRHVTFRRTLGKARHVTAARQRTQICVGRGDPGDSAKSHILWIFEKSDGRRIERDGRRRIGGCRVFISAAVFGRIRFFGWFGGNPLLRGSGFPAGLKPQRQGGSQHTVPLGDCCGCCGLPGCIVAGLLRLLRALISLGFLIVAGLLRLLRAHCCGGLKRGWAQQSVSRGFWGLQQPKRPPQQWPCCGVRRTMADAT